MSTPPIPTLPPASELRRYSRDDAEKAQELVDDCWQTDSVTEKISLLREALSICPFSFEALNAWAHIYIGYVQPPDLEKAEKTYELALEAAHVLCPHLKRQKLIEWAYLEHRPFLRTVFHLGIVKRDLGKTKEALERFIFLLKKNPSDNQGVRDLVFDTFIQDGDYTAAEKIAEEHSDGRKSTGVYFRYGFVVIDFLKFKQGVCSEKALEETLVGALISNNFVPSLLLGDIPLPTEQPHYISAHGMDEAVSFVRHGKASWERTPGLLEWLREKQRLGGMKPDDDGSALFELLQKGRILVEKRNPEATMELTTDVGNMPGIGSDEFNLTPGVKHHNSNKIVACNLQARYQEKEKCVSFPYTDVVSVPFWKILSRGRANLPCVL